jgi:hypothetical protein
MLLFQTKFLLYLHVLPNLLFPSYCCLIQAALVAVLNMTSGNKFEVYESDLKPAHVWFMWRLLEECGGSQVSKWLWLIDYYLLVVYRIAVSCLNSVLATGQLSGKDHVWINTNVGKTRF